MKKHLLKTSSFLFILCLFVVSFSFSAYAVDLNYSGGSTSNSTGASPSSSGFVIKFTTNVYQNNVGYRFSIVNSSGNLQSDSKVVNIYLDSTTYGKEAHDSAQRFIISSGNIANKKQLANNTEVSSTTSVQSCEYLASKSGFYSIPGQNPAEIGSWIQKSVNDKYPNLSQIYAVCGLTAFGTDDYVLIEPILRVKLAGVWTAATPTELAVYGASVSGGGQYHGYDGNLFDAGEDSLWNLQNYINREFPNLLYVNKYTPLYEAVSPISSGKYTYNDIIKKGYGCSVLKVSNIVPTYKNTISHWVSGFKNSEGNNTAKTAYHLGDDTFSATSGASFVLAKDRAKTIPNGLALRNTFNTPSITGSWNAYNLGTTVTQKNAAMSFEYWYDPITYTLTYDLNGGTNNSNNPTNYNVLYGKTLSNPTRTGYKFLGWKQQFTYSKISIDAKGWNLNSVDVLHGLKPGATYQIRVGGSKTTAGSADQYTYAIYDFTDNKQLVKRQASFGPRTLNPITCPSDADPNHDIRLLFYSGLAGSTSGIASEFTDVKIGYYFQNSKISIDAKDHSYNYSNVRFGLKPGETYEITAGNAKTTAGSADQFSCIIYDFTDNKRLSNTQVSFGSNLSFSIKCPSDANPNHDIRLLFYSGLAGNTNDIATEFTDVKIDFYVDGINIGATADFSSPADLYTQLSARTTGDINLRANWSNTPPHFTDSEGNWVDEGEITIPVGTAFEPMDYVSAIDSEDGDLSHDIDVKNNAVPVDENGNVFVVGTFLVDYSVTDKGGATGTYTLTVHVVESEGPATSNFAFIRFIKRDYFLTTLKSSSKWKKAPLKTTLESVLANDLKDTSSCKQVWHFTAAEFKKAREWCLNNEKGTDTNREFLSRFADNRKQ